MTPPPRGTKTGSDRCGRHRAEPGWQLAGGGGKGRGAVRGQGAGLSRQQGPGVWCAVAWPDSLLHICHLALLSSAAAMFQFISQGQACRPQLCLSTCLCASVSLCLVSQVSQQFTLFYREIGSHEEKTNRTLELVKKKKKLSFSLVWPDVSLGALNTGAHHCRMWQQWHCPPWTHGQS